MSITPKLALLGLLALSACAEVDFTPASPDLAKQGETIAAGSDNYVPLNSFAPRKSKISIAVYEFPDLTGQHKPSQDFAQYSKAVSQGADALVVSALRDVGNGTWFSVLERRFSEAVLNERRIAIGQANEAQQRRHTQEEAARIKRQEAEIQTKFVKMREQVDADYQTFAETGTPPGVLPYEQTVANLENMRARELKQVSQPVAFSTFQHDAPIPRLKTADYIITGGIIGYDSNIETGGAGARFMNVGLYDQRRKDVITVNLRLVKAATGEIVGDETVTQTIVSVRRQGDALGYVTTDRILEFEAGYATNEPGTFALDAAIRVALSRILSQKQKQGRL